MTERVEAIKKESFGNRPSFFDRFHAFKGLYSSSKPYVRFCLVVNLILPGVGDLLLGFIELGLGLLLASVLLWILAIYSLIQMANGTIVIESFSAFVYFLALAIGIGALYLASYDAGLKGAELRLANQKTLKWYLWSWIKGIVSRIRNWCHRYKEAYQSASSRGKTALLLGFFVYGIPEMLYKQFLKGFVYFLVQVFFIFYYVLRGASDLVALINLNATKNGTFVYGIVAVVFLIAFIVFYFKHLNSNLANVETENHGKTPLDFIGECRDLANDRFYVGQLIVPIVGALTFTVIPLTFMILTAFTNYSLKTVDGYANYNPNKGINIVWTGLEVFGRMFRTASTLQDLISVFAWTMIWAALATFTCYFGGLFLAMLLNKKCIKGKVIYRSLFVIAMALPQFVSLLAVKTMFMDYGPVNSLLKSWGWISENILWWETGYLSKILIICINMWVGIPYFMLLMSGLLLNIPKDLYEAADIEGASKWQRFRFITFPEILYMTSPLLITSFVSNINNFNVIWFLTGGGTASSALSSAGDTDILITWLYKLTFQAGGQSDYNLAAALGIIMFIITASVSLIVFQRSKSYNNEEEFR